MDKIIHLFSAFAIQVFAFTTVSSVVVAQNFPANLRQKTIQRICSFDPVESLLPSPQSEQSASVFSYLSQQGFVQDSDGSWICYVSDPKKEWRYYTLFKVQQIGEKLVASSFLENDRFISEQENRTLDFFMLLVEKHTKTTQGNRQSIRRYLQAFISLVKQGKVPPLPRGYLFDQPNRGFISYHPVPGKKFKGTAITINININILK